MSLNSVNDADGESQIIVEKKIKEPERHRVLLHNDDYTSMDFVVGILQTVFHKSLEQATTVMLAVHNYGTGVCGIYTQELAETKVNQVHRQAREAGFPLKCTMEKVT